jgi:aquaporin Z
MTSQPGTPSATPSGQPPAGIPVWPPDVPRHISVALNSFGQPNSIARRTDFWDERYEGRRLFSEVLGTFFLVLVAAGGGMVNARFGGNAIPRTALVVAPALMVIAIILFMGTVSGAHLNPAVSIAFALRGDFPWKRVPAYIVAQFVGAVLAPLLLWALIGRHGSAGMALPGPGISAPVAMLWEVVLTTGLVSVILGTASGAQQIGPFAAIAVGSYIALAGMWGSLVSGASMNPARSLGPALVLGDWTAWWAYVVGPVVGGAIAVGFAYLLRGPGGGTHGTEAAQGTLGTLWRPDRIGPPMAAPDRVPVTESAPDRVPVTESAPDRVPVTESAPDPAQATGSTSAGSSAAEPAGPAAASPPAADPPSQEHA